MYFSPTAFYTSKYGYKMCLRIYLNGDGTGRGSHLSLFFVVMRGLSDALLNWPFNQKARTGELIYKMHRFDQIFLHTEIHSNLVIYKSKCIINVDFA